MSHRHLICTIGALLMLGLNPMRAAADARPVQAPNIRIALPFLGWAVPGFLRGGGAQTPRLPDPLTAELQRSEAWDVYGFNVADSGLGLFLDLTGSVEFRLARVTFTDGTVQDVDLRDAQRSDGLFELVTFPSAERIDAVSVVARARSRQAKIGVRIGR